MYLIYYDVIFFFNFSFALSVNSFSTGHPDPIVECSTVSKSILDLVGALGGHFLILVEITVLLLLIFFFLVTRLQIILGT